MWPSDISVANLLRNKSIKYVLPILRDENYRIILKKLFLIQTIHNKLFFNRIFLIFLNDNLKIKFKNRF